MKWKTYIQRFFLSLNPDAHKDLLEYKQREAWAFFAQTLLVAIILLAIACIPAAMMANAGFSKTIGQFDTLSVSASAEAAQPVTLLKNPDVTYTSSNETTQGTVMANKQGIIMKSYIWYGTPKQVISWDSVKDAKNPAAHSSWTLLLILLVPGVALLFTVAMIVKYILLFLIATIIGGILFGLFKFKLKFDDLLKQALYSATPMIILDFALFPFTRSLWPVALFGAYFIISLWLTGERKQGKKKEA